MAERIDRHLAAITGLLCIALTMRIFGRPLGVLNIEGLSGWVIVLAGLITCALIALKQEKLTGGVVFAFLISLFASVVSYGIEGMFDRDIILWFFMFLMGSVVCRDTRLAFSFAVYLAVALLICVVLAGEMAHDIGSIKRLYLTRRDVGNMFSNPNAVAQIAYMVTICLLFLAVSLRPLSRFVAYVLATLLSIVVIFTLSRQGLILLIFGLLMYVLNLAVNRSRLKEVLLLALTVLMAGLLVVQFTPDFGANIDAYIYRFSEDSGRISYWRTALEDMSTTLWIGQGPSAGLSSVGIKPHSTFLWLHLAFGGVCAYLYLLWLVWILFRTWQLVTSTLLPTHIKFCTFTLASVFLVGQLTSIFAPGNYGYVLGLSIMEAQFLMHRQLRTRQETKLTGGMENAYRFNHG